MVKPPKLCASTAVDARVLLPKGSSTVPPLRRGLAIHQSACCRGAELAGPWLLRAALRVPIAPGLPDGGVHRSRWMGALHVRWLHYMGVRFATLYEGPPVPHWSNFAGRTEGDVLLEGRKICSIGEVRGPHYALLFSSTLLHPAAWTLLCRALGRDEGDAVELEQSCVAASSVLPRTLDEAACAANLRSMLYLGVSLRGLRQGLAQDT